MEFAAPERREDWIYLVGVVPAGLRYLNGHFEGAPIVPGIAQLVPFVEEQVRQVWRNLGPVCGLRRVKFMEALYPGHELTIGLKRDGERVRFRIVRGDRVCTRGTMVFRDMVSGDMVFRNMVSGDMVSGNAVP